MARKGHTKVIYKGTFVCKQTLRLKEFQKGLIKHPHKQKVKVEFDY